MLPEKTCELWFWLVSDATLQVLGKPARAAPSSL